MASPTRQRDGSVMRAQASPNLQPAYISPSFRPPYFFECSEPILRCCSPPINHLARGLAKQPRLKTHIKQHNELTSSNVRVIWQQKLDDSLDKMNTAARARGRGGAGGRGAARRD